MRLSDYKGDRALEVMADLLEPISAIILSDDIKADLEQDKPNIVVVKDILKWHKKEALEIVAIINGENAEGYEPSMATILTTLLGIINDFNATALFTSQGQKKEKGTSGSATENTQEEEN